MSQFTNLSGSIGFAENLYLGDWLKGEVEIPQLYSRDQITLNNGTGSVVTLTTGTVLGQVTSSGQFVQLNPSATDGSQNAAGIVGPTCMVPANGTLNTWAITRNAEVSDINITYPVGITTNQITTAIEQLATMGIIVRRTA